MKVVLLFSSDGGEELCKPDPLDPAHRRRRHYEEIPEDADVLVLWREWGDAFRGGYRDHTFAQGTFENVTMAQVGRAIAELETLGDE